MRSLTLFENIICEIDAALRTLAPPAHRATQRNSPAEKIPETSLNSQERRHVAGLMRVNHAGEVCAQALYQGQALTAQLAHVKTQMDKAAAEEVDHLAWCEQRLLELGSQPSLLNPIWYLGSFFIGSLAGIAGDRWSLGFVAETEKQVTEHLQKHLQKLPAQDEKSKAILEQMHEDEAHHADVAKEAGAAELPLPIKKLMTKVSKLMTHSSYHL
ncbi:2-polyprenyl-3-methyl-6-methoxy-1,4-benzoquinone monooxygenase [Legionella micdadei]|uniref:3-demethoxyubiquinol 3-hydroxylase n=1 Tax=Legionella micdadei TaxID=451 RepID=A0A098GA94_LEGMI|nr:2-polyprenyl-3-methyl-6-methoxy-1,4-benzoquinone monooxygenase [Legionella micdadei]ARG96229.1 demethoxyubiquinone hydroxylase family protein [Legionella micdadei]ARG98984.1 demethoxyubiquinone hydroxylase family protein [Legionella micdadei]KTD29041.1 ubiquinone biosynthesis protein [Legionella micdadei]NSL17252.1 2-polyprenyl-3-methyl-6-methoxy-1,4-benzoquinone monooxygenase [Legionella micdadei]CEG59404.1 2-nonaprenyl-3-methyl-6-methoxy-1,4-benzoquinol hydroxylase [Legionella micdadei]